MGAGDLARYNQFKVVAYVCSRMRTYADVCCVDLGRYKKFKSTLRFGTAQWRQTAAVGAGIPMLGMVQNLVDTGDNVLQVSGCLSGSMAYILKTMNAQVSFQDATKQVKQVL
jgi:homoserine dehydrogenase